MANGSHVRALKPLAFVLCLIPLAWLLGRAWAGDLGANPVETVNRFLGDWALRFLLASLAATPIRGILGWTWPTRLRRMVGLFAFAYAVMHVTSYVVIDQSFAWSEIWADIVKRRYITVGMFTLLMLVPLAATSTKGMARRLGGRRWRALHRLVYVAAAAAVLHFAMMVKADLREPLAYALVLAGLLGYRIAAWAARRRGIGRVPDRIISDRP